MVKLNEIDKLRIQAQAFCSCKLFGFAINNYKKALEIKEDPKFYHQIGLCYMYMGEYEDAKEYFLKAINLGYSDYTMYGLIMKDNLRKTYEAIKA